MSLIPISTFTARRVGTSIVLTAPCAVERGQYDLFSDDETGTLVYVPVEGRL